LRPPVLDELGLEASLRALEHHPAELGGGPVIVADIREVSTLSCDRATAVYRIAREATLNARRHSQADTVLITLSEFGEEEERVVRLEVRDSGVGFDLSTAPGKDHFGLAVMEEQAAVTGGRLAVDTQVGQGTCVTLEVPVAK
jgi:signal transduction histidine kinase